MNKLLELGLNELKSPDISSVGTPSVKSPEPTPQQPVSPPPSFDYTNYVVCSSSITDIIKASLQTGTCYLASEYSVSIVDFLGKYMHNYELQFKYHLLLLVFTKIREELNTMFGSIETAEPGNENAVMEFTNADSLLENINKVYSRNPTFTIRNITIDNTQDVYAKIQSVNADLYKFISSELIHLNKTNYTKPSDNDIRNLLKTGNVTIAESNNRESPDTLPPAGGNSNATATTIIDETGNPTTDKDKIGFIRELRETELERRIMTRNVSLEKAAIDITSILNETIRKTGEDELIIRVKSINTFKKLFETYTYDATNVDDFLSGVKEHERLPFRLLLKIKEYVVHYSTQFVELVLQQDPYAKLNNLLVLLLVLLQDTTTRGFIKTLYRTHKKKYTKLYKTTTHTKPVYNYVYQEEEIPPIELCSLLLFIANDFMATPKLKPAKTSAIKGLNQTLNAYIDKIIHPDTIIQPSTLLLGGAGGLPIDALKSFINTTPATTPAGKAAQTVHSFYSPLNPTVHSQVEQFINETLKKQQGEIDKIQFYGFIANMFADTNAANNTQLVDNTVFNDSLKNELFNIRCLVICWLIQSFDPSFKTFFTFQQSSSTETSEMRNITGGAVINPSGLVKTLGSTLLPEISKNIPQNGNDIGTTALNAMSNNKPSLPNPSDILTRAKDTLGTKAETLSGQYVNKALDKLPSDVKSVMSNVGPVLSTSMGNTVGTITDSTATTNTPPQTGDTSSANGCTVITDIDYDKVDAKTALVMNHLVYKKCISKIKGELKQNEDDFDKITANLLKKMVGQLYPTVTNVQETTQTEIKYVISRFNSISTMYKRFGGGGDFRKNREFFKMTTPFTKKLRNMNKHSRKHAKTRRRCLNR
jgi:hypothetical protein